MQKHNGWSSYNTFYINDLQMLDREWGEEGLFTYETCGAFHRFIDETYSGVLTGRVLGAGKARINLLGSAQLESLPDGFRSVSSYARASFD